MLGATSMEHNHKNNNIIGLWHSQYIILAIRRITHTMSTVQNPSIWVEMWWVSVKKSQWKNILKNSNTSNDTLKMYYKSMPKIGFVKIICGRCKNRMILQDIEFDIEMLIQANK